MVRLLAVDWDDVELRYLLGSVQKENLTVLKAGVCPLDTESDPATVLRTVAKEERIEPCPILLGLGRNKVELLYVTLPPCSVTEIPILLRNQLLRELPNFSEQDPLDFLALDDDSDGERHVLTATISLLNRQSLIRSFRSIGRSPKRIGLRSLLAAELIVHGEAAPAELESALSVCAVGNDVDLTILEGRRIVSTRSFRLPDGLSLTETTERIASEVQRTVTVGTEGLAGVPIKQVLLFGNDEEWKSLLEALRKRGLDVRLVDPFALEHVTAKTLPDQPGRFAPLLGLLSGELPNRKTAIDFLHPKEPPRPANYALLVVLTLFFLGILGYGLFYWNQQVVHGLEQEFAALENEDKEVSLQFQQAQPIWNVLRQTQYWDSQGAIWLDELRELSVVLPLEQDLVVTQMSFAVSTNPRFTGSIQLAGMVRDPSVLLTLQNNLKAKGIYWMSDPKPSTNPAGGGYPWLFRTTIWRIKRY